jgi:hypothetical protein
MSNAAAGGETAEGAATSRPENPAKLAKIDVHC